MEIMKGKSLRDLLIEVESINISIKEKLVVLKKLRDNCNRADEFRALDRLQCQFSITTCLLDCVDHINRNLIERE